MRKGEKGLVVLAPMPIKRREDSEERDEARVVFRSAFVFADSQTDPLPGVDPAPIEPPCEPLSGDSHRHLLERLRAFAREIDFAVALEPISGGAGGWCDPKRRRIVVDAGLPANAQVRVLSGCGSRCTPGQRARALPLATARGGGFGLPPTHRRAPAERPFPPHRRNSTTTGPRP